MRIKSFNEYITEELRKVISDQSGSGKTKSVEWIWDEPTSAKSPSAGVSLKDELRELEFQDLIKTLSHDGLDNKSKSRLRKERFKSKSDKLAVTLNNLRFLKDEQKEKGDLRCEYCGKGPLVIYDITEDELKRGPQKIDGRLRFNTKFNPKDGATCDHKQPQSKGGDKFNYSNLAVCCYRCNQRKGNMDWEKWSDVLKNRQFNESSKNLENRRLISDLFLSIADEYNIKECQWDREDSGSWLSWYNEGGNLINHFDLVNWTSNESYILRVFYRGNQHQQFSEDLDRFLERLRKFGFKNFKAQKENYTYDGKIYSVIIKSSDMLKEERMLDLSIFMSDLTGVDEEDLEDQLLEITDKFDIMLRPGLFLIDQNGSLENNKDGVVMYSSFPDVEVQKINGKLNLVPTRNYNSDYVWGWMIEIWRKGVIPSRENRICSKKAVELIYSKINQARLEKLGLDSSVVLSNSAGSEATDIYSIAIWSIN